MAKTGKSRGEAAPESGVDPQDAGVAAPAGDAPSDNVPPDAGEENPPAAEGETEPASDDPEAAEDRPARLSDKHREELDGMLAQVFEGDNLERARADLAGYVDDEFPRLKADLEAYVARKLSERAPPTAPPAPAEPKAAKPAKARRGHTLCRLLAPVMHEGRHLEAGETHELPDDIVLARPELYEPL